MPDSLRNPWSNNPNAPRILLSVYHKEETAFVGTFIAMMLYGIATTLFFRCISALFSSVSLPRGTIKWPLVAHTVIMFSILTVVTGIYLEIQPFVNIDDRKSTSGDGPSFPGPLIYQSFVCSKVNGVVIITMVFLNTWLADGLLLCRCYVVCSRNHWVVAFPFLMYLAYLALGITFVFQSSRPEVSGLWFLAPFLNYEIPYFSISFALNIILTLMIVTMYSIRFGSQGGSMGGQGTTPGDSPAGPTDTYVETPPESSVAVETTTSTSVMMTDGLPDPR